MTQVLTLIVMFVLSILASQSVHAEGESPTKPSEQKADVASDATESAEPKQASPRELITKMIAKGELKEAAAALDEAIENSPDNNALHSMRRRLASAFTSRRNYRETATQYAKLLDSKLAMEATTPSELVSIIGIARIYFDRGGRGDEVMPAIEKVEARIAATASMNEATPAVRGLLRVRSMKAQALTRKGDSTRAEQILLGDQNAMAELHKNSPSDLSAELLALTMQNRFQAMPIGQQRADLFNEHQVLVRKLIDGGKSKFISNYMSAGLAQLGRIYRGDPKPAKELLDSLRAVAEEFADDKDFSRRRSSYERTLLSYESRIESSLKVLAMYGKPAPAIDDDAFWVGVEKPLNLDGKVVLLDFWAIWCGPCIRTFPHLKHLTDEYGDKGLQVVGVTRYYNYTWDDDAKKAKRGKRGSKDKDPQGEHVAIQRFLESHDLQHPTIVVQSDSKMHKSYGVTGIPHAVLIDQTGAVQLVKVGSGKQGAAELESKIRELLKLETTQ